MPDTKWFFSALTPIFQGMNQEIGPKFTKLIEETEGLNPASAYLVQFGPLFAPEPISAERLGMRDPYSNPEVASGYLADLEKEGWLTAVGDGDGAYRTTSTGEALAERIFGIVRETTRDFYPVEAEKLSRMTELLYKVVEAAAGSDDPPGTWCISMGRNIDPGPESPVFERVRRYLLDINAFRDDAHLAAWRDLNVTGPEWEALTFVWRGTAENAEALAENLSYRGWDEAEYARALENLSARGWAQKENGRYKVTKEGAAVREKAEVQTDAYFNIPWRAITKEEMDELKSLVQELAEAMKPLEDGQ